MGGIWRDDFMMSGKRMGNFELCAGGSIMFVIRLDGAA